MKLIFGGLIGRFRLAVLLSVPFGMALPPHSAQAQTALATVTSTSAVTITTNLAVPASSGTTYVLEKYSPGQLTMSGQLTGGAGSILRTTTQTTGDTTTTFEFSGTSSTYVGGIQLWRGVVRADNAQALGTGTIYCDGNDSIYGDLTFGSSLTFANPIVLQESTTISSSNYSVVITGGITDGGSGYGITKYGTGTLTFAGANTYSGTTAVGGSTAAGGTLAIGENNGLPAGSALTIDNRSGASVLSLGAFSQNVGAITLYAGNAARTSVSGTGTLQLAGNLTLVDAHTSSQDYPLTIAAPIDLNGATRTFTVGYGNNQDSSDLGDLHLNGVLANSTGTAGVTFAPYTTYNGSVTLGAANTYNGATTLTTASGGTGTSTLALNANNAIPNNSAFVQSAGTILDLTAWNKTTGIATGMGSLTGAGTVTLGSAGVLTIGYDNSSPAAYAGVIGGAGGAVIKTGTGTLTLSGANTYTGPTTVSTGTLLVNGSLASATTVNNGGTLGGVGAINTNVTVANGGILAAGSGGSGTLTLKGLTLGASASDALTLNLAGTSAGMASTFAVTGASAFTNNGTTTINISGTLPNQASVSYTLLTYSGSSKGSGTFVLGTVPSFPATPYITNNVGSAAIQLVVPAPASAGYLTWVGSPLANWDLLGSNVWRQTGSSLPAYYTNGDSVVFDDTATNFSVDLAVAVQPVSVLVSNALNNYTLSGAGSIANLASLTKVGAAELTLATANTYSGNTTISAGTLALGSAYAIPSGGSAGNLVVNGTLDLAGYSPTVNNLSGAGIVDEVSAGGSPVLTVSNTVNSSFAGTLRNSSGSLALNVAGPGTLTLAANNTYAGGTTIAGGAVSITSGGGLGSGPVNVTANLAGATTNFLTVANSAAVTLTNNLSLPNASGTYVLTKNQTGQLTLAGTISGSGSGAILRVSTDITGDTTTVTEFAGTNSFGGGVQLWRGVVQVDNPAALGTGAIYADGNNSANGDLYFSSGMTFANPLVLQNLTSLSPGTNTVTLSGGISGTANITKYGSGTLNLFGRLAFNGDLVVNAGTVGIGSVILAGDTTSGGGLGATFTNSISIAAGATLQSAGTLTLFESSSLEPYIGVSGAGTLVLTGTNNSANSPDISFGANDTTANSTANWGARIAAPVNLGSGQRYIWGRTDHTSVDVYGCLQADCQFGGPISGSGGLTFIAQNNSSGSDGELMETPFCLNATNTFTGPVQIQRGSVYLGTNVPVSTSPFPSGNVLNFNVAAGNNGKFFLYGHNTTVADLSSTGAGNSLIADGNRNPSPIGPATLTITMNNPETYAGTIIDTNAEYTAATTGATTTLSVVKNGPAVLTLTGTNAYSGSLVVNAGKLYLNTTSSGGGAVTVNSGGTLAGNGFIAAAVTVSNGATLEAGGGTGLGSLVVKSAALGAVPATDLVTLNCESVPPGVNSLIVQNANGLTNNATMTINVIGTTPSVPGTYTLVSYSGSIKGGGSIVGGSLPLGCAGYVTNNASASAIQLVVSSVVLPQVTWVGSPLNNWDQLGSNVWVVTTNHAPTSYEDGDVATFDDTASNFLVNLTATVAPAEAVVSNNANQYLINGSGQISGYSSLVKQGSGSLTLATTNTYSGATIVSAGTIALGAAGAIPGGPGAGNVTVNGRLDVGGFSPTINNLSGTGVVDNVSAGGSPVLTVSNHASSLFSGIIQNSTGSLGLNQVGGGTLTLGGNNTYGGMTVISNGAVQVGNGGAAGALGTGSVLDNGSLILDRSDSYTFPNNVAGSGGLQQDGPGTVTLSGNLTYTGPTVVNAGTLAFPKDVTFDAGTGTTLTVASNAVVDTGFELFLNANGNGNAVDISGAGIVRLVGNVNNVEAWADVVAGENNNGISTANYGVRIASGLDLGTTNRLFWGISSRDDVATYGLNGCDCQFNGPIYGTTAKLKLLGQNSWPGVNTMEEQFAFNASNSFAGPLEITRGSVYIGNSNALNGNVLILDPAPSMNSRLFLYGFNVSVSDLQSGGFGATIIANGNNLSSTNVGPATLTVTENDATTFAGDIMDWYTEYTAPVTGTMLPTLSLVKNGPAALTLTGTNSYSGTTIINAGQMNFYGSSTGGGVVTVNANATLGGSGVLNSAVTVKNGGAMVTGSGAGDGNLQISGLALGASSGDVATLNLTPAAVLNVTNLNGLVLNGGVASATINVSGDITSVGVTPLITYNGALGGAGFAGFQLGSLPPGVSGYLSNDTANVSVDFVATLVTVPRWTGALSTAWTTNALASPKNWILDSDGVTPIDYVDGENVRFDDTAANSSVVINNAMVSPGSVTISNNVKSYIIRGSYGIAAASSLTKLGTAQVLLSTVNTYSGDTVISAGTLILGAATAVPSGSGAGSVTVNGRLDVAGFSPTVNNLSGAGIVDDVSAGGLPKVTVDETGATLFSGVMQNTSGSLGLTLTGSGTLTLTGANTYSGPTLVSSGVLLVNGSLGATTVTVQSGAALGGTGTINGASTLSSGAALDLTANSPLTGKALTLNGAVTVNVLGNVSVTNSGTYVLLNYASINSTNLFQLTAVPGILNSGYSAALNVTTNQLQLVIAPTKPTGTIADVRHVVFFTQENRSFDHYLGSLHGVHGFSDHVTLMFTNGNSVFHQPSGSSYELPFHTSVMSIADLSHSWSDAHGEVDNGWHDGWIANKGTESMAYYERSDLPYHYALADAFTVCDEFHCSVLSSTDPNRLYVFTGMIDPNGTAGYPNAGPVTANTEPSTGWGTNWLPYAQVLQKAGVTWKVYQASDNYDDNALAWFYAFKNAATTSPLYANGLADVSNLTNGFAADVSNNTLPSVSWIVGPDYGSEHPSYEPGVGGNILQMLLNALASNPTVYNNTVFIYNIDEGDGFFDHEIPILPPAGTTNEFVSGEPIGLGERVPCIIISPWSRGGYVCSQVFDHTSVLRFIEEWTGVQAPNLSAWRRQVCGDLTSAFDFAHPDTNFPAATLNAAAETVNYSTAGTTASPPSPQVVPVQESGTLIARPLPYQPNAWAALDCSAGNCNIVMSNAGSVSYHFTIYPNAYSTMVPTPYDVMPSNSTSATFSTLTTGGKYDFSCYGPNGFLRRLAGNLDEDCGQIESLSYLNPSTDGIKITLANPSGSAVVFNVTNGWFANSLASYSAPAKSTNVVFLDASTNNGWYDLTVTAGADSLFLRRFAGHIETNGLTDTLVSSENPSGYKDNVTFTASFVGYGTPTGTAQFLTNGVAFGAPVVLSNGVAAVASALLPRTNNVVTVAYSGDALNSPVTNSLTQVVLDHPPVPATVAYQHPANVKLLIAISDLLTNVADADGDTITLVGVGTDGLNLLTTNGVTLFTNGEYILYTNSVTPNVNDSFEYTVTDGYGGTSVGTVLIVLDSTNITGQLNANLILSSTNALATFFGVPNYQYVVDRSTNLTPGVGLGWVPISTNVAPGSGIMQIKDSYQDLGIPVPPGPPSAYYRLRYNP